MFFQFFEVIIIIKAFDLIIFDQFLKDSTLVSLDYPVHTSY
jgi:hypothetical protein